MSWKNIKEHYRIGHNVHIRDGKICIGSPYVPDLISITMDGKPSWGTMGPSKNDDLARYWSEITADIGKLHELIETPDTFTRSLPVYTYDGGYILEKQCEEYGWPNVTHDGCMMYDNTFFKTREEARERAIQNTKYAIESTLSNIEEAFQRVYKLEELLAKDRKDLQQLIDTP